MRLKLEGHMLSNTTNKFWLEFCHISSPHHTLIDVLQIRPQGLFGYEMKKKKELKQDKTRHKKVIEGNQ